jgi:arsenate reductase
MVPAEAGLLDRQAEGRVHVRSAGSTLQRRSTTGRGRGHAGDRIDLSHEFPKPLTDEFVTAADVVITMGCGDACPISPGKRYEDWELADPAGKSLAEVRQIRDHVLVTSAQVFEPAELDSFLGIAARSQGNGVAGAATPAS